MMEQVGATRSFRYVPKEKRKERGEKVRGKIKYSHELCRRLYTFFIGYDDRGAPSIAKFARSIGVTVADLERLRRHKRFDSAVRECEEIRRDYLIDRALDKRFDPTFVKFLLTESNSDTVDSGEFTLHLEVKE